MDNNPSDQNTLQYLSFHAVGLQGGFRKAAATLALSKSVVSARVQALEGRLGVKLLQRSTRRVQLTQAGEALFHECSKLVQQLKSLEAVAQRGDAFTGRLRVSAPVDLSVLWLSPLLFAFQRQHAGLQLSLVATDEVLEFERHGIDLSLRVNTRSHRHLYQQRLGEIGFGIYCGSACRLAKLTTDQQLDFLEEQGVVNLRAKGQSVVIGKRSVVLSPHRSFEVSDMLCTRALLTGDADVAVWLPTFMVAKDVAAGAVIDLLQGQTLAAATFHVVSDRRTEDDPRVAALVGYLKERWRTV